MANPFFGNTQPQQPKQPSNQNGFNNPFEMLAAFNQFKSNFQGNPQQMVQNLLDSGQMTKEQFQQLSGMAQMFQGLLK